MYDDGDNEKDGDINRDDNGEKNLSCAMKPGLGIMMVTIVIKMMMMMIKDLSCAMNPGLGWTDGRADRTMASAASTDIRYCK